MANLIPIDLVGCLLERLGLRDLYACSQICRLWQQLAAARRDLLRLVEPDGCCDGTRHPLDPRPVPASVRGSALQQLHHPGAMVFIDGFGEMRTILLCEQDRLKLMSWSSPAPKPLAWVTRYSWLTTVPYPRGSSGPCGLAVAHEEGTQKLFVSDVGTDRVYKFSVRCLDPGVDPVR